MGVRPISQRQQRKLDHVRLATAQDRLTQTSAPNGLRAPGWADVHLVHRSLPELALEQIDLSTRVAGVALAQPVLINAMTGGAAEVGTINRDLSLLAAELGLGMAVGSQTAGITNPEMAQTYRVVRKVNRGGVIIANLSAEATVERALQAIEMVEADLLQIHLNAPQELVMAEGDRDFRGQLDRIGELVHRSPVPVIVKECGFGVSRATARALHNRGVRAIDLSGRGGTNFAWIEAERQPGYDLDPGLLDWGIPSACSLAEVADLALPGVDLIASGGITWGSEAAKALALGAVAVGVAGAVLVQYQKGGIEGARRYLKGLLEDLRRASLLAGAQTIADLRRCSVVITGQTGVYCGLRGVDLERLARRQEK